MAEFLVEMYVARSDRSSVDAGAARAREAAAQLEREGIPIRFERTIFVPDDETSFYLFEAPAAEHVREVARRAALPSGSVRAAVGERKEHDR